MEALGRLTGSLAAPSRAAERTTRLDWQSVEWQQDSLCTRTDPEAFFPDRGGSSRSARKLCAACPVQLQCLEYALANKDVHGIWGGTSERERRLLRKERPEAAL